MQSLLIPLTIASVIATGLVFVLVCGVPADDDPPDDLGRKLTNLAEMPAPVSDIDACWSVGESFGGRG